MCTSFFSRCRTSFRVSSELISRGLLNPTEREHRHFGARKHSQLLLRQTNRQKHKHGHTTYNNYNSDSSRQINEMCLVGFATWVNRDEGENLCQRRFRRFRRLTEGRERRLHKHTIRSYNKSPKTREGKEVRREKQVELGGKKDEGGRKREWHLCRCIYILRLEDEN